MSHRYGLPDPAFYKGMEVTVGNPITGEFKVPVHPSIVGQFLQRGMVAYHASRPKCDGTDDCPAAAHLDECERFREAGSPKTGLREVFA